MNSLGFGKHFSSTYTGSMFGAGPLVFSVWGYVIAHAKPPGLVELNPSLLACMIGCTENEIQTAIKYLCSPDPKSRSKIEGGRRLVKEGEYLYRVPTFLIYREERQIDVRRQQNRLAKQRQRERLRQEVSNVSMTSAMSAKAEAEAEYKNKTRGRATTNKSKTSGSSNLPSSIEEVMPYATEIEVTRDDAEAFFDHFQSNGWKVSGRTPMKDWKAALRNWKRNGLKFGHSGAGSKPRVTAFEVRSEIQRLKEELPEIIERVRVDGEAVDKQKLRETRSEIKRLEEMLSERLKQK